MFSGSYCKAVAMAGTLGTMLGGLDNSLANVMAELGYGVSADEVSFKALLQKFPDPPSEQVVADVLLLMARSHSALAAASFSAVTAADWR